MTTIVITGASSGIGAAAARELAGPGVELAIVGRDAERTAAVAQEVGGIAFLADFDRLEDVRRLGRELLEAYPSIDVLANNAGGLLRHRALSADGVERTWQHNVLAPFVLTQLLRERLTASDGRVIFTGSVAHRWGALELRDVEFERRRWLGGWPAYGQAKRADMMLGREVPRRLGIAAYSFHPGYVRSSFAAESFGTGRFSELARSGSIPPEAGAAPLVLLAGSEDPGVPAGAYLDQLRYPGRVARQVDDPAATAALWTFLERQAERLGG
ncbi:SDR family NAD(P)-dependent oxidoreductase [Homoserinibacter sp. YIM 151385]|uniref:SDR family NAD(P)-dependent oxidoreductase n=1 Tax=Homoserinibacter sp. YIM 151385 TaxID=2985506 RepID=UPI0022F11689|nr:SDR family NAD(P)-dependent oxidoreductase [Homoserinibacter sp. YIM 151385]WBU38259.1 SDR family NAD(P)-dependent oxidoreductase [Homoserinibacter sp. YIM 151385]